MTHHDDDHYEPVRGLPELPPEGEKILWQGAPHWSAIALRVFHIRAVAIYFAVLVVWRLVASLSDGLGMIAAAKSAAIILVPAVLGLGLLAFLAWTIAKTTVYTVTNRRVAIRAGVAVSKTVNLPFTIIESAALKTHGDGTTDLPLTLVDGNKPAYLLLWPHVRPRQYRAVQPMLRGLINGDYVARLLSTALCEYHDLDPETACAPTAEADAANTTTKAPAKPASDKPRAVAAAS
ncbi:hypothetical protein CCR85_04710 [Rhodothalassium salexigens]|uniref:photosynthetic complex putative assembly protein PuhB n=1 Tax=Rhodothalassium salexigens TaxID=1086 RepID=UPI001913D144|nr:photosynthetic complex putative assembly protein PuhB [Rhodothalassium salexigens]MBK5910794.1 hypothetical protein [Rhodothalassium salexigens]MBK5920540.1 hypothetical protein [Rhodothalassium salexigens]